MIKRKIKAKALAETGGYRQSDDNGWRESQVENLVGL